MDPKELHRVLSQMAAEGYATAELDRIAARESKGKYDTFAKLDTFVNFVGPQPQVRRMRDDEAREAASRPLTARGGESIGMKELTRQTRRVAELPQPTAEEINAYAAIDRMRQENFSQEELDRLVQEHTRYESAADLERAVAPVGGSNSMAGRALGRAGAGLLGVVESVPFLDRGVQRIMSLDPNLTIEEAREMYADVEGRMRRQHPGAFLGGQVGGTVAEIAVPGGAAVKGGKALRQGARAGRAMGRVDDVLTPIVRRAAKGDDALIEVAERRAAQYVDEGMDAAKAGQKAMDDVMEEIAQIGGNFDEVPIQELRRAMQEGPSVVRVSGRSAIENAVDANDVARLVSAGGRKRLVQVYGDEAADQIVSALRRYKNGEITKKRALQIIGALGVWKVGGGLVGKAKDTFLDYVGE